MEPSSSTYHGEGRAVLHERPRRPIRAALWIVLLAVLCIGALVALWLRPWAEPEPQPARVAAPPLPAPEPAAVAPTGAAPAAPPAFVDSTRTRPSLGSSDAFVRLLLEPLVGASATARLVAPNELIR